MKGLVAALLTAVFAAVFGLVYLMFFQADTHAPAIIVSRKDIGYTQGMPQDQLLEGVSAIDDRDGDVSSTLIVANVADGGEEGITEVTYQAQDRHGNVGSYTVRMSEGETMTAGHQEEETFTDPEPVPAQDSPETTAAKEAARQKEEAKISELSPLSPRLYLTDYYTEVLHGTEFNPVSFVDRIEDDTDEQDFLFTRIQIYGTEGLNMDVPGSYELTFYLMDSEGHQSNMAILTVRVL